MIISVYSSTRARHHGHPSSFSESSDLSVSQREALFDHRLGLSSTFELFVSSDNLLFVSLANSADSSLVNPYLLPRISALASPSANGLKSCFWSRSAKEWLTNR